MDLLTREVLNKPSGNSHILYVSGVMKGSEVIRAAADFRSQQSIPDMTQRILAENGIEYTQQNERIDYLGDYFTESKVQERSGGITFEQFVEKVNQGTWNFMDRFERPMSWERNGRFIHEDEMADYKNQQVEEMIDSISESQEEAVDHAKI